MTESQIEDANEAKYQLGVMRNVEREIGRKIRKSTQNWALVQDYLLGHTSQGGSAACYLHCEFLGVDPEGYTFHQGG